MQVGIDQDGTKIYLGRTNYQGDDLPAKVIPEKSAAYVAWGGREILVDSVHVLRRVEYSWIRSSHGRVPAGAVPFGTTSDGETLYAGRANHEGSMTPGKIHCSHGCLYIPFGGKEVAVHDYEVLCLD